MNNHSYDPENLKKDFSDNFWETDNKRKEFHIGQGYEEKPCKVLICKKCGSDKFIVGRGSYYTAIKCPNCNWEQCIHDG
jgi:hypothetical protein